MCLSRALKGSTAPSDYSSRQASRSTCIVTLAAEEMLQLIEEMGEQKQAQAK
jgi:hypothetical protein